MDERGERIGRRESVARRVNERLDELNESLATVTDQIVLMCECGNETCTDQISMPEADYERLRADPALFAIVPGHESPSVEGVVERHHGYDVIRKHPGSPTAFARETDPRT